MPSDAPIMEEALKLMKAGKIPDEVSRSFVWAGLTHLYTEASKLNGRVIRLEVIVSVIFGAILIKIGEWLVNFL